MSLVLFAPPKASLRMLATTSVRLRLGLAFSIRTLNSDSEPNDGQNEIVAAGTQRTITAIGQVLDNAGNEVARREIQVTIDGIVDSVINATAMPGTDGIDDTKADNSVILGSWQEM